MTEGLKYFIIFFNESVLIYFLIIAAIYIFLNILALFRITSYKKSFEHIDFEKIFRIGNHIPVSLIIPAYNESTGIVQSIKSLLSLQYPEYQLIVINDGSTDNTLDLIIENFGFKKVFFIPYYFIKCEKINGVYLSSKYPNMVLIDKENGGKADAQNAGINIAKHPLITIIDADSILERDCLLKITRPFLQDKNVVAVGGTIRIANGCTIKKGFIEKIGLSKSWFARLQVVEYLRAFLFGRTGWDVINGTMIISGAFGCFKRKALIKVGGYKAGSLGEDMELVLKMHKKLRKEDPQTKIRFISDPVCWTETPETYKVLKSQRERWQKGTLENVLRYKWMFFNFRYGVMGLFAFPYYVLFETIGPVVEFTGYIVFIISVILNIVVFKFVIAFLSAAILYGTILSTMSVILEELSFRKYPKVKELLILVFTGFIENLGYRQLNTYWRVKAMIAYILGKKAWGEMEKKGFGS